MFLFRTVILCSACASGLVASAHPLLAGGLFGVPQKHAHQNASKFTYAQKSPGGPHQKGCAGKACGRCATPVYHQQGHVVDYRPCPVPCQLGGAVCPPPVSCHVIWPAKPACCPTGCATGCYGSCRSSKAWAGACQKGSAPKGIAWQKGGKGSAAARPHTVLGELVDRLRFNRGSALHTPLGRKGKGGKSPSQPSHIQDAHDHAVTAEPPAPDPILDGGVRSGVSPEAGPFEPPVPDDTPPTGALREPAPAAPPVVPQREEREGNPFEDDEPIGSALRETSAPRQLIIPSSTATRIRPASVNAIEMSVSDLKGGFQVEN